MKCDIIFPNITHAESRRRMHLKHLVKKVMKYLLPPITIAIILFLVFLVKGIYPFGENTIVYYDMGQQTIPYYYHIYDYLHGESALFFDWYSNLSANYAMGMANSGCFSPFILYFYFIPRNMIMNGLSLLLVLKVAAMAGSMFLFLDKGFCRNKDYFFKYLFSIIYGLCGYTLLYYTMLTWLDIMIFLPLLGISVLKLFKDGTIRYYVLLIVLCLINNYYLSIMILIYIFLCAGTYILLLSEKERKGFHVRKLAVGTFCGIFLSMFSLLPAICHMLSSKRFGESINLISILQASGADQYYLKYWMLLGLMLPAAILTLKLLPQLLSKKSQIIERKRAWMNLCSILFVLLLIPCENINLIWSFGSYVQYPLRCGFLIAFSVLSSACYYAPDKEQEKDFFWYKGLFSFATAVILFFILVHFYKKGIIYTAEELFLISIAYMAILFLLYICFILFRKHLSHIFLMCLLILVEMELIFSAYVFIGVPDFVTGYAESPEQQGDYVNKVEFLKQECKIQKSAVSRIKNPDTNLNANYPVIMQRGALSGWTTAIDEVFLNAAVKWGYSTHFTRVLDAGGTVFSDALLSVTQTISCLHQEKELYQKKSSAGENTVYDNRFLLPFGILAEHYDTQESVNVEKQDWITLQNYFYQVVSGSKKELIERRELMSVENSIKISGKKILYIKPESATEIKVNGEVLMVPTIGDMNNTEYPSEFNNGLLLLGVFEDETVTIILKGSQFENKAAVLGLMDYGLLYDLCENYEQHVWLDNISGSSMKLSISANVSESLSLLLPIQYSDCLKAYADGKQVKAERAGGLLTVMRLPKGCKNVELHYKTKGALVGGILSLLTGMGILLLGVCSVFYKKQKERSWRIVDDLMLHIFYLLFFLAFLCIYIIPILFFIVGFIVRRL